MKQTIEINGYRFTTRLKNNKIKLNVKSILNAFNESHSPYRQFCKEHGYNPVDWISQQRSVAFFVWLASSNTEVKSFVIPLIRYGVNMSDETREAAHQLLADDGITFCTADWEHPLANERDSYAFFSELIISATYADCPNARHNIIKAIMASRQTIDLTMVNVFIDSLDESNWLQLATWFDDGWQSMFENAQ